MTLSFFEQRPSVDQHSSLLPEGEAERVLPGVRVLGVQLRQQLELSAQPLGSINGIVWICWEQPTKKIVKKLSRKAIRMRFPGLPNLVHVNRQNSEGGDADQRWECFCPFFNFPGDFF